MLLFQDIIFVQWRNYVTRITLSRRFLVVFGQAWCVLVVLLYPCCVLSKIKLSQRNQGILCHLHLLVPNSLKSVRRVRLGSYLGFGSLLFNPELDIRRPQRPLNPVSVKITLKSYPKLYINKHIICILKRYINSFEYRAPYFSCSGFVLQNKTLTCK